MATITSSVPSTSRGPRGITVALAVALIAAALILFVRTNVAPTDVSTTGDSPVVTSVEGTTSTGDPCALRQSTTGGVLEGFAPSDRCAPAPDVRTGGPLP